MEDFFTTPMRMRRVPVPSLTSLLLLLLTVPTRSQLSSTYEATNRFESIEQDIEDILEEVPFNTSFADSLHLLVSPRLLSESVVCFCDIHDHQLMIVDGSTGAVTAIGRQGAGPSEFRSLRCLSVWPGQGIVVYDTMLLRLSLFSETGDFKRMYWRQLAAYMSGPYMYAIDEYTLAVAPRGKALDSPDTDNVILIPASMDTLNQFLAPEPVQSSAEDNPIGVDLTDVTLGVGVGGTVLVGYHTDYRIRRYSKDGDLLWDSGCLDESFRAPTFSLPRREGYAATSMTYNGIEVLTEIEDCGFITGIWAYIGNARGGLPPWYIDVRNSEGDLLKRIPVPDNLRVGDFLQSGDTLYILLYHLGQLELPTVRLFKLDLQKINWNSEDL